MRVSIGVRRAGEAHGDVLEIGQKRDRIVPVVGVLLHRAAVEVARTRLGCARARRKAPSAHARHVDAGARPRGTTYLVVEQGQVPQQRERRADLGQERGQVLDRIAEGGKRAGCTSEERRRPGADPPIGCRAKGTC